MAVVIGNCNCNWSFALIGQVLWEWEVTPREADFYCMQYLSLCCLSFTFWTHTHTHTYHPYHLYYLVWELVALHYTMCVIAGRPLQIVLLHEMGHALGLDHSNLQSAVMNRLYSFNKVMLSSDDIAGLKHVYCKSN